MAVKWDLQSQHTEHIHFIFTTSDFTFKSILPSSPGDSYGNKDATPIQALFTSHLEEFLENCVKPALYLHLINISSLTDFYHRFSNYHFYQILWNTLKLTSILQIPQSTSGIAPYKKHTNHHTSAHKIRNHPGHTKKVIIYSQAIASIARLLHLMISTTPT